MQRGKVGTFGVPDTALIPWKRRSLQAPSKASAAPGIFPQVPSENTEDLKSQAYFAKIRHETILFWLQRNLIIWLDQWPLIAECRTCFTWSFLPVTPSSQFFWAQVAAFRGLQPCLEHCLRNYRYIYQHCKEFLQCRPRRKGPRTPLKQLSNSLKKPTLFTKSPLTEGPKKSWGLVYIVAFAGGSQAIKC